MSSEEVVGLYSPASEYSLFSLTLDRSTSTRTPFSSTKKKKQFCRRFRNGQRVAVRPEDDGFYYPGKLWFRYCT